MGRVLIACEYSGIVRDAFIAEGHDAISCDLLPTERPGPHIQGDVKAVLQKPWDLVIAHPPCTYLCNSGVRWLHVKPGRWELMIQAADFFNACYSANAKRVAVENPVMHRYGQLCCGKPDFTVQPWQFGHGETKRTCFWTVGLPPLQPTDIVDGRLAAVHRMAPGPNRSRERSRSYPGMAAAMAKQWGCLL